MSTDLHERLHEALATAEIPSYRATLAEESVVLGHRTRRRRRVLTTSAVAAAVAAAAVAVAVLPGAGPRDAGPATTSPTGVITPAPPAPAPAAQTAVVDGRLHVITPIDVDASTVVLVPEVYSPDGGSTVELVAEQSPRAAGDDPALLGSSVVVTADVGSPGWTVAPVVRANGTYTGQVVVYGVLPPGVTELTTALPDAPDLGPVAWNRVDGDVLPQAPVPAWGEHRDVFAFSATDPGLADRPVTGSVPDVEVTVRVRVDGQWSDLPRGSTG